MYGHEAFAILARLHAASQGWTPAGHRQCPSSARVSEPSPLFQMLRHTLVGTGLGRW